MGTIDFFLSRHHEQLAAWSRDAMGKIKAGQEATALDLSAYQGSTLVYAQQFEAWRGLAAEQASEAAARQAGDAQQIMAAHACLSEREATLDAIKRSQAVIEFDPHGTIVDANPLFCQALGYTLDEIRGKHHSLFVEPGHRDSAAYRSFWERLGSGTFDAGQYKRIGKGGREVWIQASYNPVMGADGKVSKVIKVAADITADKLRNADYEGQLAAIGKSQAVIEFDLQGNILHANDNFCPPWATSSKTSRAATTACLSSRLTATAANTAPSGTAWAPASSTRGSTSVLRRAGAKSGSRPATTRSST